MNLYSYLNYLKRFLTKFRQEPSTISTQPSLLEGSNYSLIEKTREANTENALVGSSIQIVKKFEVGK